MKKFALLALLPLIAPAVYAADPPVFYAGGGIIQGESTGFGIKGVIGFKPIPYAAFEINRSLGFSSEDVSGVVSYDLVGILPVETRYNIIAKLGHAKVWGSNYDTSDSASGLLFGIGGEYNFRKNDVIRVEYENYPLPDYTQDDRGGIVSIQWLKRF